MLGIGRVIVYTGDGKGKTTAAFGIALRAAGHDLQTVIVQFVNGTWDYGETRAIETLPNVEIARVDFGVDAPAEDAGRPRRLAQEAWRVATEAVRSDRYDLLILDELNYAIAEGHVNVDEVLAVLASRPQRLSVVVTGRAAPPELLDVADTVTEMRCVKHAFAQGVPARRGIEY